MYVPALLKVVENVSPGFSVVELKELSFAVTVWSILSTWLLVHFTVVPVFTVSAAGKKAMRLRLTSFAPGNGACAHCVVKGSSHERKVQSRSLFDPAACQGGPIPPIRRGRGS